jgi:hypothetical protein
LASTPPPGAEEVTKPEEIAENVGEVAERVGVESGKAFSTKTLVAETVIPRPLVGVR